MLTLYLLAEPAGPEPATEPADPPPSCDFRLPPLAPPPCCRTKSTRAATTILTASNAARQSAKVGSASAKREKNR